jgi:hypothetical protein
MARRSSCRNNLRARLCRRDWGRSVNEAMWPLRLRVAGNCVLLALLCASCERTPQPPQPPSAEEGLKELVGVYRYIEYSKLPLPRKPDDFNDHVDSMPNALERIKQGEYVVAWGVGRSTASGAARQILVYEKKSPGDGGAVLLRDGTIMQVTAAEFAAAPKAR